MTPTLCDYCDNEATEFRDIYAVDDVFVQRVTACGTHWSSLSRRLETFASEYNAAKSAGVHPAMAERIAAVSLGRRS